METFVNFYFWWLAVFGVIQIIIIGTREYPKTKIVNVNDDLFGLIFIAIFFVWLLLIKIGAIQ